MADVTVKRVEEMDSMMGGVFVRARASLGATSVGMQVMSLPAGFEHYPEHDHSHDGQEEIYTLINGTATLHAGGATYAMEPGVFARVGPSEKRKFVTGDQPAQILAIGGVPGEAYAPPPYTEVGAPEPQMS